MGRVSLIFVPKVSRVDCEEGEYLLNSPGL
jgi:hypothetical protein